MSPPTKRSPKTPRPKKGISVPSKPPPPAAAVGKSSHLRRSQIQSNYVKARRSRSQKLTKHDSICLHLALSDDACWKGTSSCRVKEVTMRGKRYFYCIHLEYARSGDRKKKKKTRGETVRSSHFETHVDAENSLFNHRYSSSTKEVQMLVDMKLRYLVRAGGGDDDDDDEGEEEDGDERIVTNKPRWSRKHEMTANSAFRKLAFGNTNPNVAGTYNIYSSDVRTYTARQLASKVIRRWRRRSVERSTRQEEKIKESVEVRKRLIDDLTIKIQDDNWEELLVGTSDEEILMSISEYDQRRVIMKAQHIVLSLEKMNEAIELDVQLTWLQACSYACKVLRVIKDAWSVGIWFRSFNRGRRPGWDVERFPVGMRGKNKTTKALSPFDEKEGDEKLRHQFVSWGRQNLEKLSVKKATNYINNTILKEMKSLELSRLNISSPVSTIIVSRWMKECGFEYHEYKKSYEVSTHNRSDVVEDRRNYCFDTFKTETAESCWVQFNIHHVALFLETDLSIFDGKFVRETASSIRCLCDWCTFYSTTKKRDGWMLRRVAGRSVAVERVSVRGNSADASAAEASFATSANEEATAVTRTSNAIDLLLTAATMLPQDPSASASTVMIGAKEKRSSSVETSEAKQSPSISAIAITESSAAKEGTEDTNTSADANTSATMQFCTGTSTDGISGDVDDDSDSSYVQSEYKSLSYDSEGDEIVSDSEDDFDESYESKLPSSGHYYIAGDEVSGFEVMVEFHVSAFEDMEAPLNLMSKYNGVDDEMDNVGGCRSVRYPNDKKLRVVFGHDESIFRAYQLNDCSWQFKKERPEREKSLGPGIMASAFQCSEFGFGLGALVTKSVIDEENQRRSQTNVHYASYDSANTLNGTTKKTPLEENPFSILYKYGKCRGGAYWGYDHIALQLEDCADILHILFPDPLDPSNRQKYKYSFTFEFDSSSGHLRVRQDGLSSATTHMNGGWGGKQAYMHPSVLKEQDGYMGPYSEGRLEVGSTQNMTFLRGIDEDPPMAQPSARKEDAPRIKEYKTGKTLQSDLNQRGVQCDGLKLKDLREKAVSCGIDIHKQMTRPMKNLNQLRLDLIQAGKSSEGDKTEVKQRASACGIDLRRDPIMGKEDIDSGYIDKPKGVWQVAWERGFCTREMYEKGTVSVDGIRKSANGERIKGKDDPEYPGTIDLTTSLRYMLSQCTDFRNEMTQLQYLAKNLGVEVWYTPKAHPEIAGRGIEYSWGYSKLRFKEINDCIASKLRENVNHCLAGSEKDSPLNITRIRKFARKAREYKQRYAEAFMEAELSGKDPDFRNIEKGVKELKAHRCMLDIEWTFLINS